MCISMGENFSYHSYIPRSGGGVNEPKCFDGELFVLFHSRLRLEIINPWYPRVSPYINKLSIKRPSQSVF